MTSERNQKFTTTKFTVGKNTLVEQTKPKLCVHYLN